MPRMPRAVLPEVAHHLTHRGVNREPIFLEKTGTAMNSRFEATARGLPLGRKGYAGGWQKKPVGF